MTWIPAQRLLVAAAIGLAGCRGAGSTDGVQYAPTTKPVSGLAPPSMVLRPADPPPMLQPQQTASSAIVGTPIQLTASTAGRGTVTPATYQIDADGQSLPILPDPTGDLGDGFGDDGFDGDDFDRSDDDLDSAAELGSPLEEDTDANPDTDSDTDSDTDDAESLPSPRDENEPDDRPGIDAQTVDLKIETDPSATSLDAVVDSVYRTYPLLRAAATQRLRTAGQQLEATGAYDHRLDAETINQPISFYENFRHRATLSRDIYSGGQWFANYKLGRGEFEPWYRERETNEGGEFKLGLIRPLAQNRAIDPQRAALFRANFRRRQAEPQIRIELIDAVLGASVAYWNWVAAGQRLELAEELLRVARVRNDQVVRRVEVGDLAEAILPESERLVLARRGVELAARRSLQQAIARLSVYYRTDAAIPIRIDERTRVGFLPLQRPGANVEDDLPLALANRPELDELRAQLEIDRVALAAASNLLLPSLDFAGEIRKDVGGAASDPDTKEDFELQAGLLLDVPLQRRQAKGRIMQAKSDLARTQARQQIAADRVRIDLDVAAAALRAGIARLEAARESVDLARELVRIERRRFELGDSSLLEVTLREQQLLQSATDLIDAHFDAHVAEAQYRAALGVDRIALPDDLPPAYCP